MADAWLQAKCLELRFPTPAQALTWCCHLPPLALPVLPTVPEITRSQATPAADQCRGLALEGAVGLRSDPMGCQGPKGCFQGCIFWHPGSTASVDLDPSIQVCREHKRDFSCFYSAFSSPVSAEIWDAHRGRHRRDLPAASHVPAMLWMTPRLYHSKLHLNLTGRSSGWKRSDTTPQPYLPLTTTVPCAAVLITETMEVTAKW